MSLDSSDRCYRCEARSTCVFYSLPAESRREFQRITDLRIYSQNVAIVRQDDDAHGVFNVRSGTVRLSHLTPCGKTGMVKLVSAGGVLGLTEVTAGTRFQFTAETVEESTLEYAPRKDFVSFLLNNPQVAVGLLIWLSQEFEKLQQDRCETVTRPDLTSRLLQHLQQLGELCGSSTAWGVELNPRFTGQELADCLGCSRQWVSKLLGDLERRGLIERRARRIIVTDAGLAAGDGGRPQSDASSRELAAAG